MKGNIEGGFPIYILDDGSILFIKKDLSHSKFWRNQIAAVVAKKFSVPLAEILNLPYCQRRARIVENKLYCGEKLSKKLIKKIEIAVGIKLKHFYDEHETRCPINLGQFRALKTPYL
jgi:hypothetical protein